MAGQLCPVLAPAPLTQEADETAGQAGKGKKYMIQDIQTKKVEINITMDDLLAFNRYIHQQLPRSKQIYRTFLIAVPIALALITGILSYYLQIEIAIFIILVAVVFTILWFFEYPRMYWRQIDKNVERIYSTGQYKGVFGDHFIEISEKGPSRNDSCQ